MKKYNITLVFQGDKITMFNRDDTQFGKYTTDILFSEEFRTNIRANCHSSSLIDLLNDNNS